MCYYQDGMVQLQSIDQSVNQRSKKQAKLSMLPQWGQTLYQVAFLFKIILSLMKVLCRNIWNYNKASLINSTWFGYHHKVQQGPLGVYWVPVVEEVCYESDSNHIWRPGVHHPINLLESVLGFDVCMSKNSLLGISQESIGCLWGIFWESDSK